MLHKKGTHTPKLSADANGTQKNPHFFNKDVTQNADVFFLQVSYRAPMGHRDSIEKQKDPGRNFEDEGRQSTNSPNAIL